MTSPAVPEKTILFISGMQCSGKSYLQGLLRKSPEVMTIPWGIHFFITYFRYGLDGLDNKGQVDYWCKYLARWQDFEVPPGQELGNNPIAYELDIPKFREVFARVLGDDVPPMPELFQKLHYAYAEVAGMDWGKIKYIGYEHTPAINFIDTLGAFSDFRVIHMTKNMEKTFVSIVNRTYVKRAIVEFDYFMDGVVESHALCVEVNEKTKPEHHRFLKLEELLSDKESTLKKVCEWLDITYTDAILESDLSGYPFTQKKELPKRYHEHLGQLANRVFAADQETMGYDVTLGPPKGNSWLWRVLANELYLANYTNARFTNPLVFTGVKTCRNFLFLLKNLPKYLGSRKRFLSRLKTDLVTLPVRGKGEWL